MSQQAAHRPEPIAPAIALIFQIAALRRARWVASADAIPDRFPPKRYFLSAVFFLLSFFETIDGRGAVIEHADGLFFAERPRTRLAASNEKLYAVAGTQRFYAATFNL